MEPKLDQKQFILTWDTIKRDLMFLGRQLPSNVTLYGIPRGGLMVALLLSYLFPEKHFIPYNAESSHHNCDNAILIDDIMDSGKTMAYWYELFPTPCVYASLYFRSSCVLPKPHHVGYLLLGEQWIVFPWEVL